MPERRRARSVPIEVVEAIQRVGLTPAARACWLLDFSRRDLTTPAEIESTRQELLAFMRWAPLEQPSGPLRQWPLGMFEQLRLSTPTQPQLDDRSRGRR